MAGIKKRNYKGNFVGPLNGVRLLDLSRLVAGNILTQTLADFGAEVIKVEPPSGDTLRAWRTNGISIHWKIYARNKKSIAIDFRKDEAKALLRGLIPSAEIFIESFRPGTLEAMGFSPDELLKINPGLVIVRISGWGQDGPYNKRPGFGTLVEGMSGFAAINGFADREPVLPPMYLADTIAGLYGSSAVMIALREVEQNGGKGQVIDLPLLDPLFHLLGPSAANYRLTGKLKERTGSRSTNSAPRNVFKCSDGLYVGLAASTEKMAHRLFGAIGRADMVTDPRFASHAARLLHTEELEAIIGTFIAARTQLENVKFFEAADVTIGPIYDIRQIMEDPHVIDRELIADYPDPDMGELPMHHVIPRMSGTPAEVANPAPYLGQHNRALFAEVGVDEDRYRKLLADGVVAEDAAASAK